MSHEIVKKFFLMGSLLIILVLSAASISEAQQLNIDQTIQQQVGVNHPLHDDGCSNNPPCHDDSYSTLDPLTMLLFAAGLAGLAALARRTHVNHKI